MKVRSDYVSNSSSSSFILGNHNLFDYFHITKQDIMDALVDAYGGKKVYEKAVAEYKASAEKHPEYSQLKLKYGHFGPFWVYDMADEKDREEAIEMWGGLLDGWDATNCKMVRSKTNGNGLPVKYSTEFGNANSDYLSTLEGISKVYDVNKWDLEELGRESGRDLKVRKFIREDVKNPETGMYGHYEPLDKEVVEFVTKFRHDSGVMSNLDALKSEVARFFVHAEDNELSNGKVCEDETEEENAGKWDTECYTYDRVCEVLLKYWMKTGKVRPFDPKFLEMMETESDFISSKHKKIDMDIYDFWNGKTLSWMDLKWNSLTWCMHEG